MRTLRHFYTGLAFSALILSSNCTTSDEGADADDSFAAADAGNQVVDVQKDEVTDSEIPNPEQVAAETQQAAEGEAVDNNSSSNAGQDSAGDQQAQQKGPQLPEGNPDEASDYKMANDNKAAQPVSDYQPAPAEQTDSLPSLSQVVAESDGGAAPAAGSKPKKAKGKKAAATEVAATDPSMDAAAAAATDEGAPAPSQHKKKHRARKAHVAANHGGSDNLAGNFYIVQPGDTLGEIAAVIYGSSKRWQDLASANGLNSDTHIFPGDVLRYPADDQSADFEAKYKGLPRSKIAVEKGDTLSSIAERQLGNKAFWRLLWRWNESTVAEPNRIFEGQSLDYIAPQELSAFISERKGLKEAH